MKELPSNDSGNAKEQLTHSASIATRWFQNGHCIAPAHFLPPFLIEAGSAIKNGFRK